MRGDRPFDGGLKRRRAKSLHDFAGLPCGGFKCHREFGCLEARQRRGDGARVDGLREISDARHRLLIAK